MHHFRLNQLLKKPAWLFFVVAFLLLNVPGTAFAADAGPEANKPLLYLPMLAQREGGATPTPPSSTPSPTPPSPTPPSPTPTPSSTPSPTPTPPPAGEIAALVFGQDRFFEAADVATDGQGNIHFLFSSVTTSDQTKAGWQYAFCPVASLSTCDKPASWQLVDLGRTDALAQLEVTKEGLPRIWFKSTLSARPIYGYGECNATCNDKASWHFVDVAHSEYVFPSLEDLGYRHESFALDPQGRPRFVYFHYDDNSPEIHGIRYAFCNSNCGSEAGWSSVRISPTESLWRPSLKFTATGQPRIVALDFSTKRQLVYVECNNDCEGAGTWSTLPLFEQEGDTVSWSLQVDPAGDAVRIAYKQNVDTVIWFVWCGGSCLLGENWDNIALTPTEAPGGRNPALALDGEGRPHIAYEYADDTQNGLGYLTCLSDCYGPSASYAGAWEDKVVENNAALLAEYPVWTPAGCKDSSWLSGIRPALALDGQGRARFAFEADGYSYCNKGTPENPWWSQGQYWGTSRLIFER